MNHGNNSGADVMREGIVIVGEKRGSATALSHGWVPDQITLAAIM
eukprot:CAMPEP_0194764302 /NCGR_PEP_ID=MMETSP0323_2-20130528/22128_1 /TAXON_ID=2866 ORGANISM="Crypthecodinium cohnii, Strain Seligo" /NCGR_SAMPLE_ID=MMETSP0323_2 /ASSEMBLY_ACC=CAM_ASM_000346 /LENGTH=44 /DNA_ID= /DNA_START= /DNA_END= /DNA_ORIENTATION=